MTSTSNPEKSIKDDAENQIWESMLQRADEGDPSAEYWLGACYAIGDIVEKDESKAVHWYTRAAEKGHAEAQYNLGTMVIQGEGTEKNIEKGLWWMEQAFINGYEYSARVLCIFYREGLYGIEQDLEKAMYWNERSGEYKDLM